MKRAIPYFNALSAEHTAAWREIPGLEGKGRFLTLTEDPVTGDYSRLTLFKAGCSTASLGVAVHAYPEEVFIVSGRLYDEAQHAWLEAGHYACRPPGEVHGPFTAESDVLVFEVSYPSQLASE